MIVVRTTDFELYHGVVTELRDRDVTFTTIEPAQPLPDETTVVITDAATETTDIDADLPIVPGDPDSPRHAVDRALTLTRGDSGRTIVGVDPGRKPGVAVLVDDVVVAAFQVPLADTVETIEAELETADDPIVRIGDGARLQGTTIVNDLADDLRVELVDETGTTPYLGTGARGMGDVLAAANIARIEGESITEREFEPTAGELQAIKDRSRDAGETNRAIDDRFARQVAAGELTIAEALAAHRRETNDGE
ncbi:hypothetical protein C479_14393 [Halovivax asiaticus JCM 14624]|uniref:Uncharacterized protein n=1 Tax=Halovivax asiaticus JCM 14624 TaxID=1227490 RepID=M0BCB5_9EURY|nr:hypothetical protein [Halovivax asiaticus]ELZ08536.1 hypothetical protein C479_14393 [Halovivax asiaticus JCM 14624]